MAFSIDPTIMEDFHQLIEACGESPADYELTETLSKFPSQSVGAISAWMRVTNTKNGAARIYASGHHTDWLTRFINDLKNGVFK